MKSGERTIAARTVWQAWAEVNPHWPAEQRRDLVRMIDFKLHSNGYPSLEELVAKSTELQQQLEQERKICKKAEQEWGAAKAQEELMKKLTSCWGWQESEPKVKEGKKPQYLYYFSLLQR